MRRGDNLRWRWTVVGVVVTTLWVEHTVVVGVGKIDGLTDSLCVVDGAVDVDDNLRIGLNSQRRGEVPDAVP